ncbi:MAG TPA: class I SAM-dependent methyltransferase, partial [Edaphobacter sp.]|nr:class I SAM-dependent methyltransferase [Edaphobacter sp.]
MKSEPNFNFIARPYRWLEYLTLGKALERCRTYYLPQLLTRQSALVLGDGDGRFLRALLSANPQLHAEAVDTSAAMLQLLRKNCAVTADRLRIHHGSALNFAPTGQYDLVVTHFFLDCLTQPEVKA